MAGKVVGGKFKWGRLLRHKRSELCVCVFERWNLQQAAEESDIYFQFTAVCQKKEKRKRNVIVYNNNRKPVSVSSEWNVFLLQAHVKDILADTVEKTIQTACWSCPV